jgi:hypothetical protein
MSGSVSVLVAHADRLVDRAQLRLEQYQILLARTAHNSAEGYGAERGSVLTRSLKKL